MNTIGNEGNGRNLPLFNAIKSTGTHYERVVVNKPKPKAAAAAGAPPANPPKPPKNTFVKKEQFGATNKKRPSEEGLGGLVRNRGK